MGMSCSSTQYKNEATYDVIEFRYLHFPDLFIRMITKIYKTTTAIQALSHTSRQYKNENNCFVIQFRDINLPALILRRSIEFYKQPRHMGHLPAFQFRYPNFPCFSSQNEY